jgi:UDP-GlcNAc:undecaprenyl-phosphate GlcNAc-1-phosphate transferase
MNTYLCIYFGSAFLALVVTPAVTWLARKIKALDNPGPRKVHLRPVPRIGGVTIIVSTIGLVLPVLFLQNTIGEAFREIKLQVAVLLSTAMLIFLVGLIDDLRSIPGRVKLLCIVAASLAICASGATLSSFSVGTWFEVETGWAAWPLTVLWITIITVCMNFIDGLDGLAAGIAAMVCGAIALLAFLSNEVAMVVLMLALLGSVTGFLFFNFYPAKIFMGDCGSMFLGFLIGASSIICQTKTSTLVGLALPFLVLGVPIFDMGFAIVRRRLLERRSIFAPDRGHLHHRLLDLGLSQRTVVTVVYAMTAISASIGVLMLTAESWWALGLLAAGLILSFSMFACARSSSGFTILMALKHNWALARDARAVRRTFEDAEMRMRDARSLPAWWETVRDMGKQMHFQSIALWNRRAGHYVSNCVWNAPEGRFTNGRTAELTLPLHGNGAEEWEIRAHIWADGYLELSGRQAMLLARLMDEFPPPEQQQETEAFANAPTPYADPHVEQ